MCKRNSTDKNEPSTGCVRVTPQIKMKPARDVPEKLLRFNKTKRKEKRKEKKEKKRKKKEASMGCHLSCWDIIIVHG